MRGGVVREDNPAGRPGEDPGDGRVERLRGHVPLAACETQRERAAGLHRGRVGVAGGVEPVRRYQRVGHNRGGSLQDDVPCQRLVCMGQRDDADVLERIEGGDGDGERFGGGQSLAVLSPGRGCVQPELAGWQPPEEEGPQLIGAGLLPVLVVVDDHPSARHRRAGWVMDDAHHVSWRYTHLEHDAGGNGDGRVGYGELNVFAARGREGFQGVGDADLDAANLILAGHVGRGPPLHRPFVVVGHHGCAPYAPTALAILYPTADAHLGQRQDGRGPLPAEDLHDLR